MTGNVTEIYFEISAFDFLWSKQIILHPHLPMIGYNDISLSIVIMLFKENKVYFKYIIITDPF